MPKRTDINSIMIIGAGPIIIGQACEFDYSGTQACKALREEGYRIILVNSNPATIMTDPKLADSTYIEPITPEFVSRIIEKERPDAILPTMGGQTALNTALKLAENGTLKRFGVELIGAKIPSIRKAESREEFKKAMESIGLDCASGGIATNMDQAKKTIEFTGLPAVIRPSFTLGGTGGGVAYNYEEFYSIVEAGLAASPTQEVLIEESLLGWKEFEMEVVRDSADNCIIVCSIENLDPMGVHTGDSVTVAPALTLTDKEYQLMRNASIAVLREVGVDTGGSNVQFAINPENGRMVVIEMNPRVSRSSALASKATGFPIAKIAAKLAVGYTLDELANEITGGVTPASFEPTIDYVVTKIPRFTFEKFPGTEPILSTSMKSVGEGMAIGRNFHESLQKALRSMETGLDGLDEEPESEYLNLHEGRAKLMKKLGEPRPDRILTIAQSFRVGLSLDEVHEISKYDPWFLEQIKLLVDLEKWVIDNGLPQDQQGLLYLKSRGFSDRRLAALSGNSEDQIAAQRQALKVKPVFKRIDTCAGEIPSKTAYMYSTYEGTGHEPVECEADPSEKKKVVILGSGPNRIGQGIEFDYCCVHAAYALREAGYEVIMVNCNPETVSTDYDTSDRLYFEPLTNEDVISVIEKEQQRGELLGVVLQLGGQTPLKLARTLQVLGVKILGTSPESIEIAENRERFQILLQKLNLKQPQNGVARDPTDAINIAKRLGYPILIRPSYVLGGRAMEIVLNESALAHYMDTALQVSSEAPVLIDSYLQDAIEVDLDALADGKGTVIIAGIMEHIEEAGVHSGDSACSIPPYSLSNEIIKKIEDQTKSLALALEVVGLMNIQFAVKSTEVYVLEVNPRSSRTVPFVAKASGVPLAKIAALTTVGKTLHVELEKHGKGRSKTQFAVKEAVFPFSRFPSADLLLGPEMRSTGEVMGIDEDFGRAFAKAQIAAGQNLPTGGTVFISVKDIDKNPAIKIAQEFVALGFKILATKGTAAALTSEGLDVQRVNKIIEGRPNISDAMLNGEVDLVINTSEGAVEKFDSVSLRRTALSQNISYSTTMSGARAVLHAIKEMNVNTLEVSSLQSYFVSPSKLLAPESHIW